MRNYSVSDGLSSFEVYDVFQDSKGFLWFATDAGVSRYDGYRFHNYTSRDGLPDNTIFGFYEDSKGRVWFRSYSGQLSYFLNDTIAQPPINTELKKKVQGGLLLSIYVDPSDTIWLGLRGYFGLLRVLPGFEKLDPAPPEIPGHVIRELANGQFFYTSFPGPGKVNSVLFYGHDKKQSVVLENPESSVYSMACIRLQDQRTIVALRECHYIISDRTHQLITDSVTVLRIAPFEGQQYWRCLANRKGVQLVECGSDGEHVVKTILHGLSVSSAIRDHEGGFWFTTLEKGVFYMPYSEVEEILIPGLGNGEKITALASYGSDLLAVSTSFGQLFSPDSISWLQDGLNYNPGFANCLLGMNDQLIIGTNSGSIIYDPKKRTSREITDSKRSIYFSAMGVYDKDRFCGVNAGSVFLVDIHTGVATELYHSLPDRMRGICRGRGDTLWMGGLTGLWMLVSGQDPVNMSAYNPLLGQRIDFLHYDAANDRLWMSSKGVGLLLKTGSRVIDFSQDLPATCRALSTDAEGNIWVATNAGAFCVSENKGGFSVREFSMRNGLSSNDIIGIRRKGDVVWIAASDRILRFKLNEFPYNRVPPPLHMSAISINGYQSNIFEFGTSEYAYDENTIAFSFVGVSFKSNGQVLYRFQLAGADTAWTETGAMEAVYYKLPPGSYTFIVYAINNDGVSQPTPYRVDFTILQPYWLRWWFVIPIALLLVVIVTLLFRMRLRQERRREIFNRRLIEMEMTALRAQMNPHFIFNAINSIQNYVLKGDRNASSTYLAKFARLIRNVLENSSHRQISLAKELETLQLYIEIERIRFSDGFDFEIDTDSSLEPSLNLVVPLLLQPYVENAIWHGLLHKKSKGTLYVGVRDEGDMLRCVVSDDGVGRAQALINKQHRSTRNNSMGGEINLRRLQLLNDLYGTKFSLNYVDLKNPDGSAAGTRVELLVPKVNKPESP